MKWHALNIIEFLKIYQQYPVLWNMKDKEYFNTKIKPAVFHRLYNDLKERGLIGDMNMREMKTKIKSIKDVYRQEMYKILESKKNGKEVYTPKLAWFNDASFLGEVSGTRHLYFKKKLDRPQNIQEEQGESSESYLESVESTNHFGEHSRRSITANDYSEDYLRTSSMMPTTSRHVKRRPEKRSNEKEKPYDQFGMYVASELRQLPLRQAILLQQEIQSSITSAKLAYLDHPEFLDPQQVVKAFASSLEHSIASQSWYSNDDGD